MSGPDLQTAAPSDTQPDTLPAGQDDSKLGNTPTSAQPPEKAEACQALVKAGAIPTRQNSRRPCSQDLGTPSPPAKNLAPVLERALTPTPLKANAAHVGEMNDQARFCLCVYCYRHI